MKFRLFSNFVLLGLSLCVVACGGRKEGTKEEQKAEDVVSVPEESNGSAETAPSSDPVDENSGVASEENGSGQE